MSLHEHDHTAWQGVQDRLRPFSIRSLLVLTIAVAIPCSWLTVEMKAAREQKAAFVKHCITALYTIGKSMKTGIALRIQSHQDRCGCGRYWEAIFSERLQGWTSSATKSNAELAPLARLTQLHKLYLGSNGVTDGGVAHFAGLTQLRFLHLSNTKIRM